MFTLIKREIQDNLGLFIVAAAVSATIVTIVVSWIWIVFSPLGRSMTDVPLIMYKVFGFLIPWMPIVYTMLGVAQIHSDREKKVFSFLSTLTTTRKQMLTAKIMTGLLWMLIILLPLAVADIILINVFTETSQVDLTPLAKTFITTALIYAVCYTVGMQMGWKQNKGTCIIGVLAITPVFLSIILIESFLTQTVLLLLLIVALTARTWQKFLSTAI